MRNIEIVKKWSPIIAIRFPSIKNKDLIEMMSMYFEWKFSSPVDHKEDIMHTMDSCISKVKRYKISEEKYFNPIKMCLEYKLSNGDYIGENDISYKLPIDLISNLFEIEFLRKYYPEISREIKIDKICVK